MMQIRILSRRMVAPDDDFLDLRERRAGLLAHLRERAVVVEARHRGESLGRSDGALR